MARSNHKKKSPQKDKDDKKKPMHNYDDEARDSEPVGENVEIPDDALADETYDDEEEDGFFGEVQEDDE